QTHLCFYCCYFTCCYILFLPVFFFLSFFFNDTATTEIYTLSLHDALPILVQAEVDQDPVEPGRELRPPAEAPGRLVQSDERVLGEVACILGVTEDGPGETVRPLLVARHGEIERGLVPLGHTRAERFVRWLHSAVVPSSFTLSLLTPRPQGPLTLPPQ